MNGSLWAIWDIGFTMKNNAQAEKTSYLILVTLGVTSFGDAWYFL